MAGCVVGDSFVDPSPEPAEPRQPEAATPKHHLNELVAGEGVSLRSIPINAIPSWVVGSTLPDARGVVPAEALSAALPVAAHNLMPATGVGVPGSFRIDELGALSFGGVAVENFEITAAVLDGQPIALDCAVRGARLERAQIANLDLDRADLNAVVIAGIPLDGLALDGAWLVGVQVDETSCAGGGLLSLRLASSGLASADRLAHFTPSSLRVGLSPTAELCSSAPRACDECASPWGTCNAAGTCELRDLNRSDTPGFSIDGIDIDTLDRYFRFAAAASFKVAFHRSIRGDLVCADRTYQLAGEVGVAGLLGSERWAEGGDVIQDQQRWYSAVQMALTNVWGQHIRISIRHPDSGPSTFGDGRAWPEESRALYWMADTNGDGDYDTDETERFPAGQREGTFYGNLFEGENYVRTLVSPRETLLSVNSEDECRARIEARGISYDAAKHWLALNINVNARWCVLEPRSCAAHPVVASTVCPFNTSGRTEDYCSDETDLGFASCNDDNGRTLDQVVTAYFDTNGDDRFEIGDAAMCNAVNRELVATDGCSAPALADCDGDGVVDGCATR